MNYPNLFQSFRLGSISLKNRLIMSPMTMNYATEQGHATQRLIDHYVERAKGGVGLIVLEGSFFSELGRGYIKQLGIASDEHTERLKSLTGAIHDLNNDARVFIQIHHAGWRASSKITGYQPVGPSALAPYAGAETARALSVPEIEEIVAQHIQAAVRAKNAGFDGVDIHCAHGYLIPSFLSPLSNKREDAYGGDISGRARILIEIVSGIKNSLGKDFPVTIKVSGDEYFKGGFTIAETAQVIRMAETAGLDGVTVSAGTVGGEKPDTLESAHRVLRTLPMMTVPGCLVPLACELKSRVKVPVIAVGRINRPELAEKILADGMADLVAMGRALLADPYLPQKALNGREEMIRPCIACNEGCYKRIFQQTEILCGTNPLAGRDTEAIIEKAALSKNVVVIGGGPAGLEAAHAAWKKGHRVILIEKEQLLGGQLNLAAVPPGRGDIGRFNRFLNDRLKTTDIHVLAGTTATLELVESLKPDVVICAAGAKPRALEIQGLDTVKSVDAWEIIRAQGGFKGPFLVVGGGLVGVEAADCISSRGHQVSVVEILKEIAADGDGDTKTYFSLRFKESGVSVYTGASIEKIEKNLARIRQDGNLIDVPVQTVVLAVGAQSNTGICQKLEKAGFTLKQIGDCVAPRRIIDAVREGFDAGRSV